MCRQRPGFSIWPSCSTPGAARSSAGRWRTTCAPSWYWTRWRWRLASVGRRTSSTTATKAASIRQWHSASAAARPAFAPRWDRSVMPEPVLGPAKPDPGDNAMAESFFSTLEARAAQPPPVHISGRSQDGLLQLHRGLVQSGAPAFGPGIPVANNLRSRHAGRHNQAIDRKPRNRPLKRGNLNPNLRHCRPERRPDKRASARSDRGRSTASRSRWRGLVDRFRTHLRRARIFAKSADRTIADLPAGDDAGSPCPICDIG